jgi:hypothetical protein
VDAVKARAARGQTTTFYVCCNPSYPNNFLFSPPVEGRWISWYAIAHGYNGFLRWAYDAWPGDPMRDARYGSWPAGDSYLVYPGGNSGIRFEKIREGIVDYEKISIIKTLAAKSSDASVKNFFDDNFVIRHLVVFESKGKENLENPGALEMLAKYDAKDQGIPFWLIFDKDENFLADSRMKVKSNGVEKLQNTGCPASNEEVDYFIGVLKKTTALNDDQLQIIRARFRRNE